MKQASTESGKFAKVMGYLKIGGDMINTNLTSCLTFRRNERDVSDWYRKTLDSLGISADGANKVIGAMNNTHALEN
jgi:tubulin-specific chaperone A